MKSWLLLLSLGLTLTACSGAEEELGDKIAPPEPVLKIVGNKYSLSKINYSNGSTNFYSKGDVVLLLESANSFVGTIICNEFSLSVTWYNDGTFNIETYGKLTKACSKADPLPWPLPTPMKYSIQSNKLIWTHPDGAWTATFNRDLD